MAGKNIVYLFKIFIMYFLRIYDDKFTYGGAKLPKSFEFDFDYNSYLCPLRLNWYLFLFRYTSKT